MFHPARLGDWYYARAGDERARSAEHTMMQNAETHLLVDAQLADRLGQPLCTLEGKALVSLVALVSIETEVLHGFSLRSASITCC